MLPSDQQRVYTNVVTDKESDIAQDIDYVNHVIVLPRWHFYDIQGVSAECFGCYLTTTKQNVQEQISHATPNSMSS
jgi:hypothetical protein